MLQFVGIYKPGWRTGGNNGCGQTPSVGRAKTVTIRLGRRPSRLAADQTRGQFIYSEVVV